MSIKVKPVVANALSRADIKTTRLDIMKCKLQTHEDGETIYIDGTTYQIPSIGELTIDFMATVELAGGRTITLKGEYHYFDRSILDFVFGEGYPDDKDYTEVKPQAYITFGFTALELSKPSNEELCQLLDLLSKEQQI